MTRLPAACRSLIAVLVGGCATAHASERLDLEQLVARFGTDFDRAVVEVETLEPGLHVLRAAGGAVLASIGDDGVLLVDDQYAQTAERLQAAIRGLGGGPVDLVVNTHAHFDHAGGNPLLGAAGARIIAQENARRQMTRTMRLDYGEAHYLQEPLAAEGLPVLTFADSMRVHFNGHTVDLLHFGRGHTNGDAAVFFREANVVHLGDLYNARYPYIDVNGGGTLSGLIGICRAVLEAIDAESRIVSGHAAVATRADLLEYVTMLETVHARLAEMADRGLTADEAIAAKPTAEFDAQRGNPSLFVAHAYLTVLDERD